MTLIGRAIEYMPYFVYAFTQMGEKGVGKGKGRFRVAQVRVLDSAGMPLETIYENEILKASENILVFQRAEELAEQYSPRRIAVQFLTPLRIRYNGTLCDDPQFHILIRSLIRRLSNLVYFHCGQKPELPFGELIEKAESVRLISNRTRWHNWTRYSGRQEKRMKMGGIIGEVSYEGDIREFLPLLILGSWVNVGKGTSFGLGNFHLLK